MEDIRNIAIIAHVDHGKTTLVDGMLKQTHTFRENEAEMQQTTILDSNVLERERGITILAKNTAVMYGGVKINIIDTPGHADFGGEVERVLNMADAALLVIDAGEGPMPQTKFVLKKALAAGLKILVVINKIDKKDARPAEVLQETEELFLKLAETEEHLSFPVIYAVGREGRAGITPENLAGNLTPLFELILKEVPNAVKDVDQPAMVQISTLDYDSHLGKIGIGRLRQGSLQTGQEVRVISPQTPPVKGRVEKLFTSRGLEREEVRQVTAGDIVAIAGMADIKIGQTITVSQTLEALPLIKVEEPTLKITVGANTSPFAGREGQFVTGRQIRERLMKERETNLGLRIEEDGGNFVIAGRGELHLAVLLENMRREGYEMQVSKPEVIFKNGREPFEEVTIDVTDEYVGAVNTEMGRRRGRLADMHADGRGNTRLTWEISQKNLLGARNILLSASKGTMTFNTLFLGYREMEPALPGLRNGALVANDTGKAMAYSLENAQERGALFIAPGEEVYEGMIIGLNSRENDMEINVCKDKTKTNVRASTKEMKISLTPAVKMSIERALDFIEKEELLEITPQNLRLRKRHLTKLERIRQQRKTASEKTTSAAL